MSEDMSGKSVWHHIYGPAKAALMDARSELMSDVQEAVKGWGVTQEEAAKRLKTSQSRVNDLLAGKLDKFRLDKLHELATHAGLVTKIRTVRAAVPRSTSRKSTSSSAVAAI